MATAMPGQTITMRVRVDPSQGFGYWKIVRVEGDPPQTISAEQLAKDLAADPEGVSKKIKDKYLIVTGQLQKAEKSEYAVYLTPPGKQPEISASLGTLGWDVAERNKWLEPGQPIRILGKSYGEGSLSMAAILPPRPSAPKQPDPKPNPSAP